MRPNFRIDGKKDKTLFFIHGWASDKSVWQNQIEKFKKDYRVISADLRGHGQSPWVDTDNLLESFCADILELCGYLKLKQINFVGWSLAGYILFELCRKSPELVDSLIFVASTPKFLNSFDYHCGIDEPNLKLLERRLSENFNQALEEFRLFMFSKEEKEDSNFSTAWETLIKVPSPNPRSLILGLQLLQGADFRADLAGINKPTLLIAGEKDAIVPKIASEFMHEKIRGSELVIFKDCGHAPFLTQPDKFNQILNEWISKR